MRAMRKMRMTRMMIRMMIRMIRKRRRIVMMTMTMTISMAMPMAKHLFISKSFLFWWVSRKIGHQWLGS
jgi:hypothetical protein